MPSQPLGRPFPAPIDSGDSDKMSYEPAMAPLFDVSGRRVPPSSVGAAVNPACDRYGLSQPPIDHSVIHRRITEHFPGAGAVSAAEFEERLETLMETLLGTEDTREFARGVHVPFLIPPGGDHDLGQALEETYLTALGRSWKARFPKADFRNELKGGLAGKVEVAKGSRYERFVQAMADGPVLGYYFPLALSGFSVDAALQQMIGLPDAFVLSGGHEASVALAACPDLIVKKDGYPPQLDLSALQAPVARYGYHFASYGYNLTFNGRFHNGQASDYCSSGLTVLAPSRKQK